PSRRRHTRSKRDWSSDVCSSDLLGPQPYQGPLLESVRVLVPIPGQQLVLIGLSPANDPLLGKAIVLLNRMSLRSTAAVGAATLVAGATFAVTAFANDGLSPEAAANAAVPDSEEPVADTEISEDDEFFSASEDMTEEELAELRAEAEERREAARGNGSQFAEIEGTNVEEEEEEEEEE